MRYNDNVLISFQFVTVYIEWSVNSFLEFKNNKEVEGAEVTEVVLQDTKH